MDNYIKESDLVRRVYDSLVRKHKKDFKSLKDQARITVNQDPILSQLVINVGQWSFNIQTLLEGKDPEIMGVSTNMALIENNHIAEEVVSKTTVKERLMKILVEAAEESEVEDAVQG